MSVVDTLWVLIQGQMQSIIDALCHCMIEAEKSRKTHQQEQFLRESLNRAFTELNDVKRSNKKLPNARDLFIHMDAE